MAFPTTSFHLARSWMHFVQLFILIILKTSFYLFPSNFSFSCYFVGIGYHSYYWLPLILLVTTHYWLPLILFFDQPIICHSVYRTKPAQFLGRNVINPLKPELNPICYLLVLLGAHYFLHISRIRVKLLTLRWLMSYIYGAPILDVSRSHTTTQHSR